MAALRAGLPTVVLPSIWDQAEMAWRVAETGAGLRLSPRFATQAGLRRAVLRVLEERSFRDNALLKWEPHWRVVGVRRGLLN